MRIADRARTLFKQAKQQKRRALDEPTAKRILDLYGIRTPRSAVVDGATASDAMLRDLGGRVVVKLISPDVLHKSDFGGVALGVEDAAGLRAAMDAMSQRCREHGYRVEGFLLEEQIQEGREIVIGGFQDPSFGPVIMLGLGGIFVEILKDVSFRICPITRTDALEMLGELRGAALLRGARGRPPVPDDVVTGALLAVGGENGLFFELADQIGELDVNPLIVSAQGAIALDARVVLVSE